MAIQKITLKNDSGIAFSPFTGEPSHVDDRLNKKDTSLVFAYYSDAGEYEFVGDHTGVDTDKSPEALEKGIDLLIEVDADWSGVNYYGYRTP